jgi:hypothetical protein
MEEMLKYKVEKLVSNFKDSEHPNKIEKGYTFEGLGYYPVVGQSFSLVAIGRIFQTSTVTNTDKDGEFETNNSTYKITEVK